ncbi:MAG: 50S ribosomal protein L17 [Chloroflexota bacterium]
MRHRIDGRHLNRHTGQRLALYRSLMVSLLRHEKIQTTEAKAKEVAGMAHHLITLGKRGDLHARRQIIAAIGDESLAAKMIDVVGPKYKERPGGYTRITAVGRRVGDAAPMVVLELVN